MHHKFCVFTSGAREMLITGSMNPTENGVRANDNNLLIIESPTLSARYAREFKELASRKDAYKKNAPAPATVNISGVVIEQRFCPQERCEEAILREISRAQHDVYFMTFTFTADPVANALLRASERGVHVEGVVERRQESEYAESMRLRDAGIVVLGDGNPKTMHHKVFIIDNTTVITGSYNPTASANERNDENLLIIHDLKIAQEYLREYARVKDLAGPLKE
jgi:phosphatidylserine/phosphatidylglycerophosphate/cardiolipin synthase-like enzyme